MTVGKMSNAPSFSFSIVAAVNDEQVLQNSLLRSPDLTSDMKVCQQLGFQTAGAAYNQGLTKTQCDIVVFAHQDVFFPCGWFQRLAASIHQVEERDDRWAVLGVFGTNWKGQNCGWVYSTGRQAVLGSPFTQPISVRSVDEMVIVLRRSSGLRFDPAVPGFHLYGTDICLRAIEANFSCYVISNYCVHNSNGLGENLPMSFWRAYNYMRQKWHGALPITTPCITITDSNLTVAGHIVRGVYYRLRGQERIGRRVQDPERFAIPTPLPAEKWVERA